MEGYLKLYRQIIDSEIFASPNGLKIWIWCLCKASYKEKYMTIQIGRGESSVKLDVGSFLFGRFKAEQELDLSGSMIYRWMKRFEDLGMINIVSNSHYSIITICNWETYQESNSESEQPLDSRWTAVGQPLNTNKKDKKDKNIKEETIKEEKDLNWRNSFDIYKAELKEEYKRLVNDVNFIKKCEYFDSKIDVVRSIEKSCLLYWATEDGWNQKKKKKDTKKINWGTTFMNAISLPCNKVLK